MAGALSPRGANPALIGLIHGMRGSDRSADRSVARIAGRQHGVIHVRQLMGAGFSHEAVRRRVKKGTLYRVHRGVYRVGHRAPSVHASYIAGVLACGDHSALSGHAAAHHYLLIRGRPPPPEVSTTRNLSIEGVITHRVRRLDRRDVTVNQRIPITTIPRTIVDLAGSFELDPLSELCHEAQVRYRVRAAHVYDALERRPNATGAAKLHEIFTGGHIILSGLERAFLELLRSAGLPLPRTNRPAGGRYVDCRWPEHGLTVELDSYTYHHSRHAWQRDRTREREARARGDEFRHFTRDEVRGHRGYVLDEMRALLRSG